MHTIHNDSSSSKTIIVDDTLLIPTFTKNNDNEFDSINIVSDDAVHNMLFKATSNSQLLPEYLQYEISCSEGMGPVILSDILEQLYKEEDGDDNNV